MIEITTNSYTKYALVGKAISNLPEDKGKEVEIVWGMWYGMGGVSQPAWERMGKRVVNYGSSWNETFAAFEHFKDSKTISAYSFEKGYVTRIMKITVTTETTTEIEEELVHPV